MQPIASSLFRLLIGTAAAVACCFPPVVAPSLAQTPEAAVERVQTKVVILRTLNRRDGATRRGFGSGFLARKGLIVTAAHVIDRSDGVTAWLNGVSYPARVLAVHRQHDVAILGLDAPDLLLKPAALAPAGLRLARFEQLIILSSRAQAARAQGDPRERIPKPAIYRQLVAQADASGRSDQLLELQASVEKGDSGSPVIRVSDGAVVGVLSSRELPDALGVSRTCFAVPTGGLHRWLDEAETLRDRNGAANPAGGRRDG